MNGGQIGNTSGRGIAEKQHTGDLRGSDYQGLGQSEAAAALRLEHRTELNRVYQDYVSEHSNQFDIPQLRLCNVRDYGGGLVEVGFCSVSYAGTPAPKKRDKEPEEKEDIKKRRENNLDRSVRRSRSQVRRKCMAGGLDHLLTLTYRENVKDVAAAYLDFKRFVRLVRARSPEWHYVAVHELQKRGAIHFHVAVRGFQDVQFLRKTWVRVVREGNIDVQAPGMKGRAIWNRAKLAMYLVKYICKEVASLNARQRYRVSEGIAIPEHKVLLKTPKFHDFVAEIFDSLGVSCSFRWTGPDGGGHGWACSW